ncbi:MAG: hypothetical protein AAF962_20160 [Actinomycetota bacterium]
MIALDWRVTGRGAVVAVAMILLGALLPTVIGPSAQGTAAAAAFLVWAVLAFVAAGFIAGRLRLDTPLAHGVGAALLAALVMLIITLAGRAEPSTVGTLIRSLTILAVAAAAGAAGSLLADRVHRWQRARRRDAGPVEVSSTD